MVIGVLGILKAGGAYLPIDPSTPSERLLFTLEDSGALVVLTRHQMADTFSGAAVQIVCFDTDREAISRESERCALTGVSGDNLAYLIYTSGSTGQPKAVMITHNGVVNYLCWCRRAYRVEEGTGAPIQSPLTFDLTVTSLFSPLAEGKTIVLVREEEGIEGLSTTLLGSNNYSLVKITPAHLKLLSQRMEGENPEGFTRAMVIGGEALHEETLTYWRTHAPSTRLINEYGPTETVVGCCVYEVERELSGTVPMGRPIANTEIYILDNHLRPVPVGVTGEIYVGGAGVARGYLKRPDITGEKFVPDPFSNREGARLYKTGDLGRLRADDQFEYIGRDDDQVKIRGYRIELEEVRTVLESAPGVDAAVVVARNDITDENRLVGYVTLKGEPSIQELRSYMKRKLPEYMIPSSYVTMKSFPLTQNGKVDRKALPDPSTARPELQQAYAEPRTDAEQAIAGVWRQVLRLDAVGVNDNFFDLGGDSILMLHVFSQLRDKFEKDLTVLDLFQYPTIAALAKFGSQITPEPVTVHAGFDRADRKRRTLNRRARVMEARQKIS
jgi:amino acid adenylation domain-containing protein